MSSEFQNFTTDHRLHLLPHCKDHLQFMWKHSGTILPCKTDKTQFLPHLVFTSWPPDLNPLVYFLGRLLLMVHLLAGCQTPTSRCGGRLHYNSFLLFTLPTLCDSLTNESNKSYYLHMFTKKEREKLAIRTRFASFCTNCLRTVDYDENICI